MKITAAKMLPIYGILLCSCRACPEGFELRKLKEDHAKVVAPYWAVFDDLEAKEAFFKILIRCYHSAGIFSQEDPEDKPIAWCLQYVFGQPGHLYVTEPYRRRGFATLLMRHICRCIKEDGLIHQETE